MSVQTIRNWVKAHDEEKNKNLQGYLVIGPYLREELKLTSQRRKYFNRIMVKNLIKLGQNEKGADILSWKSM